MGEAGESQAMNPFAEMEEYTRTLEAEIWNSPFRDPARDVRIPTLRLSEPPNQFDFTKYDSKSALTKEYMDQLRSVVRIRICDADGTILGAGSGFFVSEDGLIGTAEHVAEAAARLQVVTYDGKEFEASVQSAHRSTDVALVKIDNPNGNKFEPLPLADSSITEAGSRVTAMGHPVGWQRAYISPGVFTDRLIERDLRLSSRDRHPQRTVIGAELRAIGGCSGGPLLNEKGEVIGVMNLGGEVMPTAFSAPVEDLRQLISPADDKRSYFLPEQLHWGRDTTSALGVGATSSAFSAWGRMRPASSIGKLSGFAMGLGGVNGLRFDLPYASTAWTEGTTAEKVSTAINVLSDTVMLGSGVMAYCPGSVRKYALPIGLVAVGARMANSICAMRKY